MYVCIFFEDVRTTVSSGVSKSIFFYRGQSAVHGYDGEEMYQLPRYRLDSLLGEEAARMAGQIELSKNINGVREINRCNLHFFENKAFVLPFIESERFDDRPLVW